MEETPAKFRQIIQNAFETRSRARDETVLVRRYMAARLGQILGEDQLSGPLALVDPDIEISDTKGLQGLQKQYVDAVRRNLKVRMEFAEAQKEHADMMASLKSKDTDSNILDLHLEVARLQQRHDKLAIVQKYLEQLEQQPAADSDFLDPALMYKDCSPLPNVPKEMVDGFTIDHDATDAEVEQLLQKLQKTVLRSKLVARQEKQRFEQTQVRDPIDPKSLAPEVKLHALDAVKNTLINWIESQLSKASDDETADETGLTQQSSSGKKIFDFDAQLADIKKEYQRHLELRKEILALLAQQRQIKSIPHNDAKKQPEEEAVAAKPPPTAYILTPYIEELHTLAREQKSLMKEKAHINTSLSRQQEDTKMALDHLTQESQLLPQYPAAKTSKPKLSFGDATRSINKPNVLNQVQPWICASDSAKIATLETVAEKVEEGMMSVDECRETLEEMCKLLNLELNADGHEDKQTAPEKDLWLPEGDDDTIANMSRKDTGKSEAKPAKTIWSILDGNLGSINN